MRHLAIIMDGNRRWARMQGMQPSLGHSHGLDAVQRAIAFCLKKEIAYLSLYTFSIENFKRSEAERTYFFSLLISKAQELLEKLRGQSVAVKFIGDRSLFPDNLRETIQSLESGTSGGKKLQVNLLFCYGARQEIVSSVKSLIQKIKNGLLAEEQINEQVLTDALWTAGIPEPDLIIRTGGARRMSNFLLFQAAYSELYFLDCMWPEITEEHLQTACASFEQCQRNFGI